MFNIKQALLQCKTDEDAVRQTLSFIEENEGNAYSRKNAKGHITGSAFVVDGCGNILLNHHKKANIWIQFGGHCDSESDVREVALRETMEETGFAREDLIFLSPNVFDCGVYDIPEGRTKGEPAHKHYDINFLIMTKTLAKMLLAVVEDTTNLSRV